MGDRINSRSENGYIRWYDVTTGDTVDVLTGGPKIIQHFNTTSEMYTDSAVNSSTSVIADGVCTITLGSADNDDHDFTSGLIFDPSKGLTAEAWIRPDGYGEAGFGCYVCRRHGDHQRDRLCGVLLRRRRYDRPG